MKQSTGLPPVKITVPWATGAGAAFIRQVPVASQIGLVPGAASFTDGFPPLNATALASGGVPPSIQDTNYALQIATAWNMWTAAAGITPYDSTFQTTIGGYPNGAVVYTATTTVLGRVWVSTVDNNTTNPDTGGAGWTYLCLPADVVALANSTATTNTVSRNQQLFTSSTTFTVPTGVTTINMAGNGGGGGGGGGNGTGAGSGGGGGEYASCPITVVPGETLTITVGAGTAGASPGFSAATAGTSSVKRGSTVIWSAVGGTGGLGANAGSGGNSVSGGTGGVGTGLRIPGGASQSGFYNSTIGGVGGSGGTSSGSSITSNTFGAAQGGNFPGGGGGGSTNSQASGTGGNGLIYFTY